MDYRITISEIAEATYFENLDFLFKYWSIKEVEYFIHKTEEVKKILQLYAFAFKVWELDKSIRIAPIVEQITFFIQ